ncbi:MAG: hypothetical protein ACOY3K_02950 [Candidatus Omnitrophota bacterium]
MKKETFLKVSSLTVILAASALCLGGVLLAAWSPLYVFLVFGFGLVLLLIYEVYIRLQHNIDAKNDLLRSAFYPAKMNFERHLGDQTRKIGLLVELVEKLIALLDAQGSALESSELLASIKKVRERLDEMSADELKIREKIITLIDQVSHER